MDFDCKKTKKDIVMEEEDEEHYRNTIIRRFCARNIESDKVRDHLTSKNRGPAHSKCNVVVTQKQSKLIPFVFHSFSLSSIFQRVR